MTVADTAAATMALEGFAGFVRRAMADWQVPGAAVAIVKDGQVVFAQGFGQRDVQHNLEVTPQTLFAIGSCTKAFTCLGLGILVDDGKLDWDVPVRTYLLAFKMHDPFASERMTPRDLVTHRSGLPRHDPVWYSSAFSRQELFDRLQYLQPNKDFRAAWQYQNLMYMAAGFLAGQVSGRRWEDFTRERILDPLGMTNSNFSVTMMQEAADFALPYHEQKDEVKEVPFRNIDAMGPAGSINSSVMDMAQWLLLQLGQGTHGQTRIVSEAQMAQMHTPQMVMPAVAKYAELPPLASYGLGWGIQSYRAHTIISHSGGIDGFASQVMVLPEDHIGIVVLTNRDGHPLPWLLCLNVCDRLLGLDEVPWHERFHQEHAEGKEAVEKAKGQAAEDRVTGTAPSHPLQAYVGEFQHPAYGLMTIDKAGEWLQATLNTLCAPLEHYHYDIFEWNLEQAAIDVKVKVSFSTNTKGDIDSLSVPLEAAVEAICFTRRAGKEMTEKAFLKRFAGQYELPGMLLTVAVKGDTALVASIPGQPDYELVPYKGTEFTLKGLTGFSIAFKDNAQGQVAEAVITQPNGVFTATRKVLPL